MLLPTLRQMAAIDREAIEKLKIPVGDLMEKAGGGVAASAVDFLGKIAGKKIAVLSGKGNNGGDGLVAARELLSQKAKVKVFLLAKRKELEGAGLANLKKYRGPLVEWDGSAKPVLQFGPDLIIDALFGTGFTGTLPEKVAELVSVVNQQKLPVLAVDVPSGFDADEERPMRDVFSAVRTVTFAYPKVAQVFYPGREFVGRLQLVDIGIPPAAVKERVELNLITPWEVAQWLPGRNPQGHKGTFGKVFLLAGSLGMTGAAALAAEAVLRSGAGMVFLGTAASLCTAVASRLREVVIRPLPEIRKKSAIALRSLGEVRLYAEEADIAAVGPGLGQHYETIELVQRFVAVLEKPLVLDADGLNAVAKKPEVLRQRRFPTVLTPHSGELARLLEVSTEEILNDRVSAARRGAAELNSILLLKGTPTVIAAPRGEVWVSPTGNSGMATAGSGDVLTGLLAGLLAQGMEPMKSACAAAFLHGWGGDLAKEKRGKRSLIAGDILVALPDAFARLQSIPVSPPLGMPGSLW
ncbi:MAG: NAD(P)H-hydrate dehydratase [candidate division Zixibacteria bacterium]|nr:NAD(P)H-hydrate dehydratase [candidate division Zixibacteria bacterium]